VDPFIGQIMMFAGNFAPRGWATCDGQLLQISSNQALFSLLGTAYGGDGRTTFALPDLRGRFPMHCGHAPGLTARALGQKGGAEQTTLNANQMPSHTHAIHGTSDLGDEKSPKDNLPARVTGSIVEPYKTGGTEVPMAATMIQPAGGGQPIDRMPPFECVQFIIALQGIFPSRS